MEETMNKITAKLLLILTIVGLIGVIIFGAWWHLLSVAVCYLLYSAYKREEQ